MAAIRRRDRADEWWVDFRFQGQRIRKRSPVQTKRGAEQYERCLRSDLVADVEAGRDPFAGPPPTFAEFAERWMREYVAVLNRPSTQREKRVTIDARLTPVFGRTRIDKITTGDVDTFIASCRESGLSPKRINNVLTVLRRCLRTAVEWGCLATVPTVRTLRAPVPEMTYLTTNEVERLVAALRPGFWRTFILFLLNTGARFGEAAALRWEDLELEGNEPRVRIRRSVVRGVLGDTKTGDRRVIPLLPDTAEAFRAHPRTHDFVFAKSDGRLMRPDNSVGSLRVICQRAGIKRIGWHALRHTCATELVARGAPLRVVQEVLGHTSIQMTCRYAHAAPSTLRAYVNLLAAPIHSDNGHQADTNASGTAEPQR